MSALSTFVRCLKDQKDRLRRYPALVRYRFRFRSLSGDFICARLEWLGDRRRTLFSRELMDVIGILNSGTELVII